MRRLIRKTPELPNGGRVDSKYVDHFDVDGEVDGDDK